MIWSELLADIGVFIGGISTALLSLVALLKKPAFQRKPIKQRLKAV